MTRRSMWLIAVIAAMVLDGCGGKKRGSSEPPPSTKAIAAKDVPDGLAMRLSDGKAGAGAYDHATVAAASRLGDTEVAALLARTKPLAPEPADVAAFAVRPGSRPPPRAGQTIATTFPPAASTLTPPTPADASKDVRVVRWMPEGKVPLAPELSITFSQPMIAVTSQADAAQTVPVKLTPTPKGRWRWIGTRTIVFDPEVRFPQATTYRVEVPAGTTSATGLPLAEPKAFTFETPAPTVVSSWPTSGPQRRDAPMFVLFDQKIDAPKVLAKLAVTAGGASQPVRMLSAAEVEAHETLAQLVKGAKDLDGRWLAFRTTSQLPADTSIQVTILAGTPSAEGPNVTSEPQTFSFKTFPPLRVERAQCGYGEVCRPRFNFDISFNNPLDEDKFDPAWVEITPPTPTAKIYAQGTQIVARGPWQPRTKYTVKIAGALVDDFGQQLGKPETRTFDVGDREQMFFGARGLVVVDPAAPKPTYDVFTSGYDALTLQLYKVAPSDYPAYLAFVANQWSDAPSPPPGKLVFDQLVKTTPSQTQIVETKVDLAPALDANGRGHVLVVVKPVDPALRMQRLIAWVQSTRIAVDVAADGDILQVFATDLATATPLAGVALTLRPSGLTAKTDERGLATLAAPAAPATPTAPGIAGPAKDASKHVILVAQRGDDVALLTESQSPSGSRAWNRSSRAPVDVAWYVTDDRELYRPGEEVSLKGWLRQLEHRKGGDVAWTPGSLTRVDYVVHDAQNVQIAKGSAQVNALGGFDARFTLPKAPNLGGAYISFRASGPAGVATYNHGFRIEEFRRPEFEVTSSAGAGPFLVGGGGDVTVAAKYFTGAPLPGANVNWFVTASPTTYTPPNRDDYVFGTWQPWWGAYDDGELGDFDERIDGRTWSHTAKTDAIGEHVLHLDFLSVKPSVPMSVTASA
ncbi:MAG TPA: Ig-like domain-containing protein, partial [Kofleriaceae bacterium]|nr:Ig-like domain-containing protein [Kofleriaceae bacterium]